MPDCAPTTLTVSLSNAGHVDAVLDGHNIQADSVHDTAEDRTYVWDDAPWGADYLTENDGWGADIASALRESRIAYTIYDGGHYTWNPHEIGYRPGMELEGIEDGATRLTDLDGTPTLPRHTWDTIRRHLNRGDLVWQDRYEQVVKMVDGYYDDDPTGWTIPQAD